jgi:excisionase family DNA binding protein
VRVLFCFDGLKTVIGRLAAMNMNLEAIAEQNSNERGLLSEREAAKYIGVCRLTLLRLRQRRQLGFFRVGSRVLYSIDEHIKPFLARSEEIARIRREGARRAEGNRNGAPRRIARARRVT